METGSKGGILALVLLGLAAFSYNTYTNFTKMVAEDKIIEDKDKEYDYKTVWCDHAGNNNQYALKCCGATDGDIGTCMDTNSKHWWRWDHTPSHE